MSYRIRITNRDTGDVSYQNGSYDTQSAAEMFVMLADVTAGPYASHLKMDVVEWDAKPEPVPEGSYSDDRPIFRDDSRPSVEEQQESGRLNRSYP